MSTTKSRTIERIYPLTPMQEGMLFHKMLDENSTSYVVQEVLSIKTELNEIMVSQALELLSERHPILRTAIVYKKVKKPQQVLLINRKIELAVMDISYISDEARTKRVEEIKNDDVQRGFDLEKDSLLRVTVLKCGPEDYKIIWSFHHIIMDGWCLSIICSDFLRYYLALKEGSELKSLRIEVKEESSNSANYEDYIQWIKQQNIEAGLDYWRELLKNYDTVAEIYSNESVPETNDCEPVDTVKIELSKELSDSIVHLCRKNNVTTNTLFEVCWGIVLQRYNHVEEVVFGKVVSGRNVPLKGIDNIVGLFINTIPVRFSSRKDDSFESLVNKVYEQAIESGKYDFCPLGEIQRVSEMGSDKLRTLMVFENYYVNNKAGTLEDILSIETEMVREQTNYPINLLIDFADIFSMIIMYEPNLYSSEQIQRLLLQLQTVIQEIVSDPSKRLTEIEIITSDERKQILYNFNDTKTTYPKDKTIHELFEAQVRMTPHAEAVICPNERFTYDQLDRRSNEIKGEMIRKGVRVGELIGIVSEKSVHMIAGILAILKCGCGYVPIDRDYPESRLRFILEDCDINTILCGTKNIHHLEHVRGQRQVIDIQGQYEEYKESYSGTAHDVAYVIYTSGSTGQPKGVVVEHQNVVRLVKNTSYVDFEGARILQTGALSFDAATFEIWGALLNGGMLCLVETDLVTAVDQFSSTIQNYNINMMWMTSQLFNNLIDRDQQWLAGLRTLLIGGEKLSEKHVNKLLQHRQDIQLINGYGPTENTTFSVCLNITKEYNNIPIGKPISNSTAYIMNGNTLSGIGMPGELCVGGDGVARGYLNRDELTQEKFVDNPYAKGERMYRTGDLARWLPDGNIEYLGRMDEQVKIRGYRIELGEIASVIRRQSEIRDVAVIAREDKFGDKYICAYVVSENQSEGSKLNLLQIKSEIKKELPDYMVPSYFVEIEQFTMTNNGKLDKRNLPEPEFNSDREYIAPRNDTEEKLAALFMDVLGVDMLGVNDHFFEMGGNSIKAISVIARMRDYDFHVSLLQLFKNSTVAALAEEINANSSEQDENVNDLSDQEISEKLRQIIKGEIRVQSATSDRKELAVFVEDHLFNIKEEILNEIEKSYPEIVPNVIFPISIYQDNLEILKDNGLDAIIVSHYKEPEVSELMGTIHQKMNELSSCLLAQPIVKTYPLLSIQKLSFIVGIRSSYAEVDFNRRLDIEKFEEVMLYMLKSHPLLRTKINIHSDAQGMIELECPDRMRIPCIDLTYLPKRSKDIIVDKVRNRYNSFYNDHMFTGDGLSQEMIIIKRDERNYTFIMPCSHLAFDGMSNETFCNQILDLYKNKDKEMITGKEIIQYDYMDYVNQIKKGPTHTTQEEMMNRLELGDFDQAVQNYQLLTKDLTFRTLDYVYTIEGNKIVNIQDSMWRLTGEIYVATLKFLFPKSKIPVFIVHTGRKLMDKDYYDYIGEFIDFLPYVIDTDRDAALTDGISEKLDFLREHNINMASLFEDTEVQAKYPDVALAISGVNLHEMNIPTYNYLAIYNNIQTNGQDESHINIDKGTETEEFMFDRTTTNVNLMGDKIYINTLCIEGQEEALQLYLTEFIQKILSNY